MSSDAPREVGNSPGASSVAADNLITTGFVAGAALVVFTVCFDESSPASPTPPRPVIAARPVLPPATSPAEVENPAIWTYGSSQEDVRRIEGEPDRGFRAGHREIWFYRRITPRGFPVESQVRFDSRGKVEAWVDLNRTLHAVGHGMPRPPRARPHWHRY